MTTLLPGDGFMFPSHRVSPLLIAHPAWTEVGCHPLPATKVVKLI
jgi:hypothetical protein